MGTFHRTNISKGSRASLVVSAMINGLVSSCARWDGYYGIGSGLSRLETSAGRLSDLYIKNSNYRFSCCDRERRLLLSIRWAPRAKRQLCRPQRVPQRSTRALLRRLWDGWGRKICVHLICKYAEKNFVSWTLLFTLARERRRRKHTCRGVGIMGNGNSSVSRSQD